MNRFKPQIFMAVVTAAVLTACGGGGGTPATPPVATQLQLLAGNIGGPGNIDGVGGSARFSSPNAAARAPSGEIYVADTNNHLIRRIDTDGKVSIWAGTAPNENTNSPISVDGPRLSAQFVSPRDMAFGKDGTLYVAAGIVRTISTSGLVGTLQMAGAGGGGIPAWRLVSEPSGNLFIATADLTLHTVSALGEIRAVPANFPADVKSITAIGVDRSGRRLVAGRAGGSVGAALYRLAEDGTFTQLAGDPWTSGTIDGDSTTARFGTIASVVEDANGDLIIADDLATLVSTGRVVESGGRAIRRLSPNGVVSTLAGLGLESGSTDGSSGVNRLCGPRFISPYDATQWLIADSCNHTVRLLGSDGHLKTLAGQAPVSGDTNGTGDQARFAQLLGIATTQDGNTYVTDFSNSNIRRISASGQTSVAVSLDSITGPTWLTSSGTTGICFADQTRVRFHSGIAIRCTGPDGSVRLLTNSFSGEVSYFSSVYGMASDQQGNLLIADGISGALRVISSAGTTTTLATNLKSLGVIATGSDGVAYMKIGNSVQKRMRDGALALVAGSPDISGQQNGAGPSARFGNITALAVDALNYLYVADYSGSSTTIRLISPSGEVSTLAGRPGQFGVRLGIAPGSLASVNGLAVATDQKSLQAITANGVIRIILQR